ncbi:Uncharacterized protein QTN25_001325 [Entamoeba marina]
MQTVSAFRKLQLTEEFPNIFVVKERLKSSKIEMVNAKRESKNRDAAQQAFLIGALSQMGYNIEINRLYKKGTTTFQLFTINTISSNHTLEFDVNKLHIPFEGLKERRQYLDAVTNNKIIELLEIGGATFEERRTRKVKKENSVSMKRIMKMTIQGQSYDMTQILAIGKRINDLIKQSMSTKKGIEIVAYDRYYSPFEGLYTNISESSVY